MQTQFLRKGATIRTLHYTDVVNDEGEITGTKQDGHSDQTYTDPNAPHIVSINAAKRASRQFQQENGGLGMGSLKVVARLPS